MAAIDVVVAVSMIEVSADEVRAEWANVGRRGAHRSAA